MAETAQRARFTRARPEANAKGDAQLLYPQIYTPTKNKTAPTIAMSQGKIISPLIPLAADRRRMTGSIMIRPATKVRFAGKRISKFICPEFQLPIISRFFRQLFKNARINHLL